MPNHSKSISALKRDKRFARLIKKHGLPVFKWNNFERGNAFQSLCRSIIYQQVSGAAAATILARFVALFPKAEFPTPLAVREIPVGKMRGAGLSAQKASYIKDLALKFSDGTIRHESLNRMTNEEIVGHLTQVKGIGVWTVHMFLIFALNRPDGRPRHPQGISDSLWPEISTRPREDGAARAGLARACLCRIMVFLARGRWSETKGTN